MKKFLVQYLAPASVIDDWKKTDPAIRKDAEEKMMKEWQQWMKDHAKMVSDKGAAVGNTKRVNTSGVSDFKNDILIYGIVDAESHDEAAKAFEGHPHLQIPQASIQISELNQMGM